MDKQKLADYLNKYMSQGYSFEDLKAHLSNNGISANEIDDALKIKQEGNKSEEKSLVNQAPIEINILAGIYFMFSAMLIFYSFIVLINPAAIPQSEGFKSLIGNTTHFSFFLASIGIISAFVGYGVLRVKPWAKTEGILVSIVALFTVIGMIVTIMTLYFFTRKEVKDAFEKSLHLRLAANEIKKENLNSPQE